jgi:hypothetical protein
MNRKEEKEEDIKSRKKERNITALVKSVCYLVANNGTKASVVQRPANRSLRYTDVSE